MKGAQWDEKDLNAKDLKKDFNHGLVVILQKGKRKDLIDSADTEEYFELRETTKYDIEEEEEELEEVVVPSFPDKTTKEIRELANEEFEEESEESTPFSISVWDLGGQDEFISTPHLFLNTEATILIVMDITKELYKLIGSNFQFGYLNSAVDVLHYWLNFFHNAFAERKGTKEMEPNVALVLTHKDQLSTGKRDEYICHGTAL